MPAEEDLTPEQLADAHWRHYAASYGEDPDKALGDDLFWGWQMVDTIVRGGSWRDTDAPQENRPVRSNRAWYNEVLSPDDAARLRRFGGDGGPGGPD